jgi:ABC-2 type transport system permease protein
VTTVSAASLTVSQVRYVNKTFWRNPTRAFFTFVLPLMFLVIFTALLGNGTVHIGPLAVKQSTYYVAAMASFAVILACYANVALSLTFQRESGILKRIDGSPLPKMSFMTSRVLHAIAVAGVLVVITAAFGWAFYSAHIPSGAALFRSVVMLFVGAATFCALGLAVTAVIPNADASQPIVQATVLPLAFLSGIFIPFGDTTPTWIVWVAKVFPIWHFAQGMLSGFVGTPFHWTDVAVVAVWGAAGLLLAVRYFSWLPRND